MMARQRPIPPRRYWWLTVVWATAIAVAAAFAATTHSPPLLIFQAVVVGTVLWSTLDRTPRPERRLPHLVFCFIALAVAAVMLSMGFFLIEPA